MSSRALSLATVLFLIGFGASDAVLAQATNLEAGKAPSQIFAQTCNACHKSPRGLLKTVAPGSLPGFLRQHYTTSSDMAGVLASYLVSNGATDARYQSKDGGKDKKDGAKEKDANTNSGPSPEHQGRRQRQEAAKPEGEGGATPAPEGRQKRA
jgi:mono/diheme cytochrome c family protein